jgi:hypothetical protein
MKFIKLYFLPLLLFCKAAQAQIVSVMAGTDVTIKSGTVFHGDGLTLTPGADFVLGNATSNTTLTKATTAVHTSVQTYIARVYQFSNTSSPFSGSVQIDYTDGAELNGIAENALTLNVHNGTNWNAYLPTTRDGTANFILTNIDNVALNEMTLADAQQALPLTWLSFTAIKQTSTVLVEWSTAQEQNTKNFSIQHSIDGANWQPLAIVPAAGNGSAAKQYSYVHANPATGKNYYRILQTDIDNKFTYSTIRYVLFNTDDVFTVLGNPVTNGVLRLQVTKNTLVALFAADGKLLWQGNAKIGITYINVSGLTKGTYFLKANTTQQKIIIQ